MDAPAYTLTVEARDRYLYAHVGVGHTSPEVVLAYWAELAVECERLGADRLLCVEDLAGHGSPSSVGEIVAGLVAMGFSRVRIAYVNAADDATLLVGGEIHARRQGLVARVFRRFEEAEGWLLES